jgi:hypothetical protein
MSGFTGGHQSSPELLAELAASRILFRCRQAVWDEFKDAGEGEQAQAAFAAWNTLRRAMHWVEAGRWTKAAVVERKPVAGAAKAVVQRRRAL